MPESLDSHTCDVCALLDGKVMPMSEFEPGVTVPPSHPNCRGTTCPHIDDEDGKRIARDVKTGKAFYVPANMTFEQWQAKQNELHGAGTVELQRKMNYNKAKDKAQ